MSRLSPTSTTARPHWSTQCCTRQAPSPVSYTHLDVYKRQSLHDLGWLVYLGVFPTAIAFSTYGYALRYLPASRLGVTTYLVPPIAALISLVLLREVPPVITWIGGAMCLLGVALTRRQAGSSRVAR